MLEYFYCVCGHSAELFGSVEHQYHVFDEPGGGTAQFLGVAGGEGTGSL